MCIQNVVGIPTLGSMNACMRMFYKHNALICEVHSKPETMFTQGVKSSYQYRGKHQFLYQINVQLGSAIGHKVATHVNPGL